MKNKSKKHCELFQLTPFFPSSGEAVTYKEVLIGKGIDDDTFADVAVDLEEGYPIRLIKD